MAIMTRSVQNDSYLHNAGSNEFNKFFAINISLQFAITSFVATNLQMNINKHGIVVKCKLIWHVHWGVHLMYNWRGKFTYFRYDHQNKVLMCPLLSGQPPRKKRKKFYVSQTQVHFIYDPRALEKKMYQLNKHISRHILFCLGFLFLRNNRNKSDGNCSGREKSASK